MKKRSVMAKSLVLTIGIVGIVYADNRSWTGFYAGADAGFVFNNVQLRSQQIGFTNPNETCNISSNFSTFSSGIHLGYLYQFPNAVVSGIEAGTLFNTNQQATLSCNSIFNPDVYDRFTFRNQMQTSIKGKVGRPFIWNQNTFLPYVTIGASFANLGLRYNNEGGNYYSEYHTPVGLLIGLGVEWAFMPHWTLRAEYSYVNYGNALEMKIPSIYGLIDPNGKGSVNLSSNNVVVGINYWI